MPFALSLRSFAAIAFLGLTAACSTSGANLGDLREEFGDFRL
mgnify:CR=1 FL=1